MNEGERLPDNYYRTPFAWGDVCVSRQAVERFGLNPYAVNWSAENQPAGQPYPNLPSVHIDIDTTEGFQAEPVPPSTASDLYVPIHMGGSTADELFDMVYGGQMEKSQRIALKRDWDAETAKLVAIYAGIQTRQALREYGPADLLPGYHRRQRLGKALAHIGMGGLVAEAATEVDASDTRRLPLYLAAAGVAMLGRQVWRKRRLNSAIDELSTAVLMDVHDTICKNHAINALEAKLSQDFPDPRQA